jgi:hypothetical protein
MQKASAVFLKRESSLRIASLLFMIIEHLAVHLGMITGILVFCNDSFDLF